MPFPVCKIALFKFLPMNNSIIYSLSLGSFTLIIPNIDTQTLQTGVDVAVNFLPLVIFVFLLFVVMVMYANEVETKEKYKLPEIKN